MEQSILNKIDIENIDIKNLLNMLKKSREQRPNSSDSLYMHETLLQEIEKNREILNKTWYNINSKSTSINENKILETIDNAVKNIQNNTIKKDLQYIIEELQVVHRSKLSMSLSIIPGILTFENDIDLRNLWTKIKHKFLKKAK